MHIECVSSESIRTLSAVGAQRALELLCNATQPQMLIQKKFSLITLTALEAIELPGNLSQRLSLRLCAIPIRNMKLNRDINSILEKYF